MKIVIFDQDLRSEMQMYLALSNHFEVSIAEDEDDLMQQLDRDAADFTFLDLDSGEKVRKKRRATNSSKSPRAFSKSIPRSRSSVFVMTGTRRSPSWRRTWALNELLPAPLKTENF